MKEVFMIFIEGALIGALVVAVICIFAALVYKIIRFIIDEDWL